MHEGARNDLGPLWRSTDRARLGFGAWAVGGAGWGEEESAAEREGAVRAAADRGVTVFDTAPTYGNGESERVLGRALAGRRDQVAIATKVGPRDDPRDSLEESLRRLRSDYVDLVQLHEALERWEWRLEGLHQLQIAGKARAVGLCNATHLQLERAVQIAPVVSYQGPYNLFDRDVEERLLPLCRQAGLGFLAYRPLASGLLGGTYTEAPRFSEGDHRRQLYYFKGREFERRRQVIERLRPVAARAGVSLVRLALSWLLSRSGVTVVLAGVRNRSQAEELFAPDTRLLTPETVVQIDATVTDAFRLPRATPAARTQAATWGERERFIVERLDGAGSAEAIAAAWTDRGEQPMIAAQVKVFADQLAERDLAVPDDG